ncbi:hypothetical protein F4809DRAFT_591963 [Biscogniauxia mediterranea]|nr:hypothetical protein F4809DRAFT_591963 [Biscogniauxia mediterranea]
MKGISIRLASVLVSHAAIALGIAVPHPPGMLITGAIGQEDDYTTVVVTDYTIVTVFETTYFTATPTASTITTSTGPPPTTVAPTSTSTFTGYCDYRYCVDGTSICIYWAGYTSWDVSLGPIPGEIPTAIGTC